MSSCGPDLACGVGMLFVHKQRDCWHKYNCTRRVCANGLLLFVHRWRDSCQKYHPTWKHMFWDNAAAEQLLEEKYPWFLETWRMYPRVVHRGQLCNLKLADRNAALQ